MQIEHHGHEFAVTTGGYESPIPSNALLDLEETEYQTKAWEGSFSADEVDLPEIFSCSICPEEPIFTLQFDRSSDVNDGRTYQVFGQGKESLAHVSNNIPEISTVAEDEFRDGNNYSTHRPFLRAHSRLIDGSVLYAEVYYYGPSTDSVKRFELRTFHPNIPFGTNRYDDIFEASPVEKPPYIEDANVTRHRIPDLPERATQIVEPTISLGGSTIETVSVENPFISDTASEEMREVFQSPNQLFAESYLGDDEIHEATMNFRAVSIDDLEPIFYKAEVH